MQGNGNSRHTEYKVLVKDRFHREHIGFLVFFFFFSFFFSFARVRYSVCVRFIDL